MRHIKVHSVTFNVGDCGPPKDDFKDFLGVSSNEKPDVIFIGLQEAQEQDKWIDLFKSTLKPFDYVLIKTRACWAIYIFAFVKRNLLVALTNIESEVTASGAFGLMGNKGGVSIRFELCGVNIIAVCAHFTAHANKESERISDYLDILGNQTFRDTDVNKILDHDYVIWMGDLNFRIDLEKPYVESIIATGKYDILYPHDQLNKCRANKVIFENFEEGPLKFAPTYKFNPGTDIYDTSEKQRVPSWTDRILFLSHDGFIYSDTNLADQKGHRIVHKQSSTATRGPPTLKSLDDTTNKPTITLVNYDALTQYKHSDHRPVYADLLLKIPDRWFSLPIQFFKPAEKFHFCDKDLKFEYTIMKRPMLTDSSTTKSILNPSSQTLSAETIAENFSEALKNLNLESSKDKIETEKSEKSDDPLPPAEISTDRSDWIGIYPVDFDDLHKGYISYVYAPSGSNKISQQHTSMNEAINKGVFGTDHVILDQGQSGKVYTGTIDKKYLEPLAGRDVQLVFYSDSKSCPQGYSKPFSIYHKEFMKIMNLPDWMLAISSKDGAS